MHGRGRSGRGRGRSGRGRRGHNNGGGGRRQGAAWPSVAQWAAPWLQQWRAPWTGATGPGILGGRPPLPQQQAYPAFVQPSTMTAPLAAWLLHRGTPVASSRRSMLLLFSNKIRPVIGIWTRVQVLT